LIAGEGIKAGEYYHLGRITEFKYGEEIGKNKDKIQVKLFVF